MGSPNRFSEPATPWTSWTAWPPAMSTAGSSSRWCPEPVEGSLMATTLVAATTDVCPLRGARRAPVGVLFAQRCFASPSLVGLVEPSARRRSSANLGRRGTEAAQCSDAQGGGAETGHRVVVAEQLDPRLRLAPEDEQRDLTGQPPHGHGRRALLQHRARAGDAVFDRHADRCIAGHPLARHAHHRPQKLLLVRSQRPRRPLRLRAPDVLVVHEVLDRVHDDVDLRHGKRREGGRAVAELLDEHREIPPPDSPVLVLGEPRQRRNRDPHRRGTALTHHQVYDEVLDRPPFAQGRLVTTHLQGKVAQLGALGLGHPGHGLDRRVVPVSKREGTLRDGFAVLGVAIRREPWIFTLSTLGSLLFGALTVADAWVLGWATDHVVLPAFRDGDVRPGGLFAILALFVAVALLRAVGIVARRLGAGVMQYRMQAHYRRSVTRQYLRLPMSWHQRHPTGELLSNANSDVEAAWAPIAPLPMAVGTVAMMVIAVGQMLFTDVVLALVGLLVFPLVIVTNIVYQRLQSPLMTRAQALRAELSEVAHESFDGALVVKTLGRESEETERFADKAHQLRDTNIAAGRIRAAFDPVLEALPSLGVLAVLAVGVVRVEQGTTDPGDVVTVCYLLTIVSFPIRSLGWLVGEFPRSVVGFWRVQRVLDATGEMAYGDERVAAAGSGARLEVRDLNYRYAEGAPLLSGLTFTVEPGRTVAVVGATASGKSTLTALLLRLVDPDDGQVLLDGRNLRDLEHGSLAEHVSLVPQQAFLFDDTVRGNITLGADVPDEAVWAALRTAQADGFVAALPHGLDTRLGERGTTLSGGQRQRLSLARALVRNPRLLVMDDATSAVDPEVEARILAALRGSAGSGSATVVVVAYRKATIALADEVVYLRDGRVADQGTHAELLARNPGYADLVNAYEQEQSGEVTVP